MLKNELLLLTLTAVMGFSWAAVAAPNRAPGHPQPRAVPKAPVTLQIGDTVAIGGRLYTIGPALIPAAGTPTPSPAVLLTGYAPNPVTGGQPVTLSGAGFLDASASATWNSQPLGLIVSSPTTITATAPAVAAAVTAPVILTSSGQTVTGPNLTVTPAAGPPPDMALYGFRNAARDWVQIFGPGQTIFIEGKGFGAAKGTVAINHGLVPVVAWSDTEIQTTCPALATGAQPGPATLDIVRADKGAWNSSMAFQILPPPARFGNR